MTADRDIIARDAIELYAAYIDEWRYLPERAKKAAAREMLRRHDPNGDALPDPAVVAEGAIEAYEEKT